MRKEKDHFYNCVIKVSAIGNRVLILHGVIYSVVYWLSPCTSRKSLGAT